MRPTELEHCFYILQDALESKEVLLMFSVGPVLDAESGLVSVATVCIPQDAEDAQS